MGVLRPVPPIRWLLPTALLGALAAFESGTALFKDDFGYLAWGQWTAGEPWEALRGPLWFTYRRPLNTLVWWLSAQAGIDGEVTRWVQVALWTTLVGALLHRARASAAATVTVLLLVVTNQALIDLLAWRSWVTTTGGLAFLVLGALALERGVTGARFGLYAALAAGFKEVATLALAARALPIPGARWVGALVAAAVAVGGMSSAHKLGLGNLASNVRFHLDTLALFVPLVPVVVATVRPRLPPVLVLALALLALLPPAAQGVATLVAVAVAVWTDRRWLLPGALALALPALGLYQSRQYLLELWTIAILALLSRGSLPGSPAVWLTMLALGARPAVDFERNRAALRATFQEQRAFLDSFHPPPAQHLYFPDPHKEWDLDTLYWARTGATFEGEPPAGSRPVQVGPRSGVWADLAPADATAAPGP